MNNNVRIDTANGGYAEIVKHSVTEDGKEIMTFSLRYGLIVHAELLRHKLLNHSVKSNRAIPCKKIRKEVLEDPYIPVFFGSNQPGMVANNEHKSQRLVRNLWKFSRYPAVGVHWCLDKLGLHKEVCNRLLNPWQWVRETCTATEWDNLFNLRLHEAAQRDIQVLTRAIYEAKKESYPELLREREWHVPYVTTKRNEDNILEYFDNDGTQLDTQQAIECSAARCARSSYDNHDGSKSTWGGSGVGRSDKSLHDDLIMSDPKHASPGEHIGTPMRDMPLLFTETAEVIPTEADGSWEKGVTHLDRYGNFWSGNFKGFIQYRQTLDNHACWNYEDE